MNDYSSLIAQGKLEDALNLYCSQHTGNDDCLLLLSRFNVSKREYSLGLMDFSDWSKAQAQITNSFFELTRLHNSTPVHITINFNTFKEFQQSIETLDVKSLMSKLTDQFQGTDFMVKFLPLKQDYESYALLNKPFPLDYLTTLKAKVFNLYSEYVNKSKNAADLKLKTAVEALHNSLTGKVKTRKDLLNVLMDFEIFFLENPRFAGITHIQEYTNTVNSRAWDLYENRRPDTLIEEIEKIVSNLSVICRNVQNTIA